MKIFALGWYDHDNVGDESYKLSFPILFPEYEIKFTERIKEPNEDDIIILGGGDIAYDGFTKQVCDLPNKKIACSISLTKDSDFKALRAFDSIFVRDMYSQKMALDNECPAQYLPDFAFMLKPDRVRGIELLRSMFEKVGHKLKDKIVILVLSNYLTHSGLDSKMRDFTTFQKVSQDIANVCDNTDASFIFMPFSTKDPWDDRVSNSWTANRCRYFDKNLIMWDKLSVQDTLDIIAAANVLVSSRLHASIFSTISGVPFVDLTHHTKNLGFLQTLGKVHWSVNYWEFCVGKYRDLLYDLLKNEWCDKSLWDFSDNARKQLTNAIVL